MYIFIKETTVLDDSLSAACATPTLKVVDCRPPATVLPDKIRFIHELLHRRERLSKNRARARSKHWKAPFLVFPTETSIHKPDVQLSKLILLLTLHYLRFRLGRIDVFSAVVLILNSSVKQKFITSHLTICSRQMKSTKFLQLLIFNHVFNGRVFFTEPTKEKVCIRIELSLCTAVCAPKKLGEEWRSFLMFEKSQPVPGRDSLLTRAENGAGTQAGKERVMWYLQELGISQSYYMTSSVSGQDEPNRALWLATRAGKMERYCPLGISRLVPQDQRSFFGVLSHIINPLLTKIVRSRWLDIGLVLFLRVYGPRLRLGP